MKLLFKAQHSFFYILITLFTFTLFLSSCGDKTEEKTESSGIPDINTVMSSNSYLNFYNSYVDASNRISIVVNNFQQTYQSTIPDPDRVTGESSIQAGNMEEELGVLMREVAALKSSFNEGILRNLSSGSPEIQGAITSNFLKTLESAEAYIDLAQKVFKYYNTKAYEKDISNVRLYDTEIKKKYNQFDEVHNKLIDELTKYKPKKERKNPDNYSDPDERTVIIQKNAYDDILGKSEALFARLGDLTPGSGINECSAALNDFRNSFQEISKTVISAPYSEKTMPLKQNYEDEFTVKVNSFINDTEQFLEDTGAGKLDESAFNIRYDAIVASYNDMLTSYNAGIIMLQNYKVSN